MKIPSFKKFHKNRRIYENNILEPSENFSIESEEDIYNTQAQAQMGTTTKPVTPTKPTTAPVPPGTQNPNQQPTITPVKAQAQAQGRYPQAQAQMGTTTKPTVPTKPLIPTVPPGTQNPNQQPTITPVKAQAQAQGRYSQAQRTRQDTIDAANISGVDYKSSLVELSKLLPASNMSGQNEIVYKGMKIEQASENGHFFVDQVDTKTTTPEEAKKYIDNMLSGRGAQMGRDAASNSQNWKQAQRPQAQSQRNRETMPPPPGRETMPPPPGRETMPPPPGRETMPPPPGREREKSPGMMESRYKTSKKKPSNKLYEFEDRFNTPYTGADEKFDKITTLNQKLAIMKGQKSGYDTLVNRSTEQTLTTLNSIQEACVNIETNISGLMSTHGYQSIQTILERCLMELNKLSSKR